MPPSLGFFAPGTLTIAKLSILLIWLKLSRSKWCRIGSMPRCEMRGQARSNNLNAILIDSHTFSGIIWVAVLSVIAVLVGIIIATYFVHRRRRHTERLQMMELLKRYFQGGMPADELGQRARGMTDERFVKCTEFYSLVIAAFQRALDANLKNRSRSQR